MAMRFADDTTSWATSEAEMRDLLEWTETKNGNLALSIHNDQNLDYCYW